MANESPRRRVRRAKQSRPIVPGFAATSSAAEPHPAGPLEAVDDAASLDADGLMPAEEGARPVEADATAPVVEPDAPPDSNRDGAWLPAGIAVLMMVSLLICAGLVLIAAGKN